MAYDGPPYQEPPNQGPYGPYPGPPQEPYEGPTRGPYQGPGQGPFQGPGQGPYQGPGQGPYQGPTEGPYPAPGPYPGPGQAPYPGPPQGPYQGPHQGPYQGPPGYGVPTHQYSDWIHRVGGFLIDWVPYFVLVLIGSFGGRVLYYLFLVIGIGYWAYNRWLLGGQGQSYGKRVVGMRLLSEDTGQPIGTLNAFLRDLCHFIDGIICFVGFLFPLWDVKRQTIADKIMRTVVVPA
jgi:uncharacterized RDD family membrane protein YckC